MGKGKALRRRVTNAVRSRQGNLALAQLGKGTATLPLPSAPTPKSLVDKPSASLRKMLALKEAAAKQQSKPQRRADAAANRPPQQHAGKAMDTNEQPSTSGRDQPRSTQQGSQGNADGRGSQQQQQQGGAKAVVAPFQQVTTLKPRKKEYLKNKALKKKGKNLGRMQEALEKERATDHVAFGERNDKPLTVNLKRKHWVHAERSASERCKTVFLQQMQMAEKKAQGTNGDARAAGGAGGAAAKRAGRQLQEGSKAKVPKLQGDEHEEVRQQVIDAYRARRNTRPAEGAADLGTLRQLSSGLAAHM